MRMSVVLPIAVAVAVFAIESSGEAFAASRSVTRDHRATPVVRDHRAAPWSVTTEQLRPPRK